MNKERLILVLSLVCLLTYPLSAATGENQESKLIVERSRIVVEEMMLSKDKKIPEDLIKTCAGLAIIPGMVKGGFFLGGSYGHGIVMANKRGVWTGPAFMHLGAGSIGVQFGVQSVDLILVIIGEKAMDSFLKSRFKLGGDVAIAAGPIGAQATAATEILLKGGIYSYSRSKGIFVGVSLEGAGIVDQPKLNQEYYGAAVTTSDILKGNVTPPATAQRLITELNKIKNKELK